MAFKAKPGAIESLDLVLKQLRVPDLRYLMKALGEEWVSDETKAQLIEQVLPLLSELLGGNADTASASTAQAPKKQAQTPKKQAAKASTKKPAAETDGDDDTFGELKADIKELYEKNENRMRDERLLQKEVN